jgi:two-component system, chemotaxis family, CheB/CheR fusion protein
MADLPSDELTPVSPAEPNFFVVGIGASAGGLRALEEFFENMPVDSGAAFVVIQHLSPDFKSLMKELLERRTRMEIYRVTDGMVLEANSIYLIPPGKNLTINNQRLHLLEQGERNRHGLNFPIDIFLESLAKNYAEKSIGVILSGTGSDGTNGLRAINEVGGLALVQDPSTAEFDGMPRTAISTGLVDRVLSPQDLAQTIYQLVRSGMENPEDSQTKLNSFDSYKLQRIASILAKHENIDFSHYKLSTLSRRIHRRCLITSCNNLEDYIRLLEVSNEERNVLRHDLLISVTQFFRDAEAWRYLETFVIPKLIEQAHPSEELRFWVTACATGEEAYSLAMLVDEAIEKVDKQVRFKIFATDIDKEALEKATLGIYPETILHDITADRLQRYFVRKEQSYQVIRKLREKLLFAPHDLTKDAGFTRMNMISCRNVLIYMQPQLQQQVLRNLHFSLQSKGIVFLGEAETLGDLEEEFKPLNKKGKIYEKRRDVRLPVPMKGLEKMPPKFLPQPKPKESQESRLEPMLNEAFSAFLVEQKTTCLLVDKEYKLFHIFNHSLDVLKFTTGRTTIEVTKLVIPTLQLPLTTALHRARRERTPVIYTGIKLGEKETTHNVTLKVSYHETNKLAGDFFMVVVQEDGRLTLSEGESFQANTEASQRILELEYELQQTRENLQAVIEELETTNEEQQATNEELTASNEELQSTNEELHSVNEELYTVNAEYQSKIEELTELNNDIDNLLRSTDIGVVFLDRVLRIRKFTPAATVPINLVAADIGRPLQHITHNLDCVDLMQLLQETIDTKVPVDREVKISQSGFHLLMRVNPYQQEDGRLDGIVLTFVDIDDIKQVEQQLKQAESALRLSNEALEQRVADRTFAFQQSEQRLRAIMENTTSIVYLKDTEGRYLLVNRQYRQLLNLSKEQILGKTDRDFFPPAVASQLIDNDRAVLAQEIPLEFEENLILRDGEVVPYLAIKAPLRGENDEIYALCCIATNITEQKQIEEELRESAVRERATLQVVEQMRQTLDPLEIFRTTSTQLQETLKCDRVVIYQFRGEEGGGVFVAEAVNDGWISLLDAEMYDCKITQTCWYPGQDRQIFIINDVQGADWDECHRQLYGKLQAKACCIIPVFDGDRLWGLLGAYQNDRPRTWKSGEVTLLTQVAIQLGVSIQQTNLFTQIQNQSLQLQQAKETAESANQAKSNFIAHMNHELRTPLNAILGSTQMLQQDTNLNTAQKNSISLIQKSGQHLQTLIDDILSLAKIEAGKLDLQLSNFPLLPFLDNLIDLVRLRAYQQGIELQFQPLSPLPDTIYSDETRLRQVLLNLLSNAIKFTQRGSAIFKVGNGADFDPAIDPAANMIRFQIEDTGIGIPQQRLEDIFLPFEQIDSNISSAINEGTGLGLSISQNIVRLLGGEIKVTSTLDRGSTFWFDLYLPPSDSPDEKSTNYAPCKAIGYHGRKRRIAIVDDRADNRAILVNFLGALGFEILEADNGETAIEQVMNQPIDVMILDLVMPGINGWEVTRRLRQSAIGQQIKIIATSASNLPDDRSLCYQVGCDDFITKPIQFSRLLNLLQQHLGVEWIEPEDNERQRVRNLTLPSSTKLQELSELASQGDIRGILKRADLLAAQDPQLVDFVTEIHRFTSSFQIDKLQQFLHDLLNTE